MIDVHTPNITSLAKKSRWSQLLHHKSLILFVSLVFLSFLFRKTLFAQVDQIYMRFLLARTQPASIDVSTEVRRTVKMLDSISQVRDVNYYQLNILIDKTTLFVPVGVQFLDADTSTIMSNKRLTQQDNELWCWDYGSFKNKKNYQTEWLSDKWVSPFAPSVYEPEFSEKRRVNLIVDIDGELFLVEGLEVHDVCSSSIVD